MVKVPEIVAYFIRHSESKEKGILALILGSRHESYIYNAVKVANRGKDIGISGDEGYKHIVSWAQHATEKELLGLVNGWEVDTDGR